MGFLGFGNYSKPGKGVSKNAPEKKRFFLFFELFFRKFWKLIQVNFLFVLAFVPLFLVVLFIFPWFEGALLNKILAGIITVIAAIPIGPATTGLTYVLRNYAREQHSFIFSDFKDAVKDNWKQSVPTGILLIIVSLLFAFTINFYYLNIAQSMIYTVMLGITIAVALLILFASYYVYLLIITVDLKLTQIYKNALILAILGLKTNLITTFFVALIVVPTFLFYPISLIFIIVIIPALVDFIICFNSFQYIKKFCIDPYYDKIKQESPEAEETSENVSLFSDETPNDKI